MRLPFQDEMETQKCDKARNYLQRGKAFTQGVAHDSFEAEAEVEALAMRNRI